MSPEQAMGEEGMSAPISIAWGRSPYNMLAGEKPYQGSAIKEIVQQHLRKSAPKLPSRYRQWQFFLNGMMSKDK